MSALDEAIHLIGDLLQKLQKLEVEQSAGRSTNPATGSYGPSLEVPPTPAPRLIEKKIHLKKVKPVKESKPKQQQATTPPTPYETFAKANLQVGRVVVVEDHPSGSEKLWKCQVEVADGQLKQVVAGMKQHVSKAELLNRLVVVLLNLKPAKLGGELSEAMMLAACAETPSGELVQLLMPPEGAAPGDKAHLEGMQASTDFPKILKSDMRSIIDAGFKVSSSRATFEQQVLVTKDGPVTVPTDMPDGAKIK